MMEPAIPPNPNTAPAAPFTVTGPAENLQSVAPVAQVPGPEAYPQAPAATITPVAATETFGAPAPAATAAAPTEVAYVPAAGVAGELQPYKFGDLIPATPAVPQPPFASVPSPDPLSPGNAALNFGDGQTSPDGQRAANTAVQPAYGATAEPTQVATTQPGTLAGMPGSEQVPDLSGQLNALLPTTPSETMAGLAVSDQAKAINNVMGNTSNAGDIQSPSPTETFSQMTGNLGPENQDGKGESKTRLATVDEVIAAGKNGLPQVEGTKFEGPFLQGFSIAIGTAASHRN